MCRSVVARSFSSLAFVPHGVSLGSSTTTASACRRLSIAARPSPAHPRRSPPIRAGWQRRSLGYGPAIVAGTTPRRWIKTTVSASAAVAEPAAVEGIRPPSIVDDNGDMATHVRWCFILFLFQRGRYVDSRIFDHIIRSIIRRGEADERSTAYGTSAQKQHSTKDGRVGRLELCHDSCCVPE